MLDALQTLLDNGLPEDAIVPIVNDLFKGNGFEDDDDVKRLVLLVHRAQWESDLDCNVEAVQYDDCAFSAGGNEYLVLDEDEKESRWEDALENLLDDCVEGADGPYFDREAWKRDARFDGAGHILSGYNGAEEEVNTEEAGSGYYFIYRTN